MRLGRVLWNNRLGVTRDKHHSTASIELLSEDTVRLTLRRRLNWKPGQHAYVVLPTVSDLPTEAHPFTIASIPTSLDGTDGPEEKDVAFIIRGRNGFTGRLRNFATVNAGAIVPAFIDGPYGCPPDLNRYSTCILIAGLSVPSLVSGWIYPILTQVVLGCHTHCHSSSGSFSMSLRFTACRISHLFMTATQGRIGPMCVGSFLYGLLEIQVRSHHTST